MHRETEQLLHANRELWALLRLIVDGHVRTGGRFEMRRCLGSKALAQSPRQTSVECSGKVVRPDLRQRSFTNEKRREPFGCRTCQGVVGQIRPFITLG